MNSSYHRTTIHRLTNKSGRKTWERRRKKWERQSIKYNRDGKRRKTWPLFCGITKLANIAITISGLKNIARKNAFNPSVNEIELLFEDLPANFDGYRICHMSDLHFDLIPGIEDVIVEKIRGKPIDLAVFTGDYRHSYALDFDKILPPFKKLTKHLEAPDGRIGILGNHDTHQASSMLEAIGIKVLINESLVLKRADEVITITGLDDVHYFYTKRAKKALTKSPPGFKIALVHSPELYDVAAASGYHLYLTGHTHGGQICFPGGRPIITHLKGKYRKFVSGLWKHERMVGYTNNGTGVSGVVARLNCQGEITIIKLRKYPGS